MRRSPVLFLLTAALSSNAMGAAQLGVRFEEVGFDHGHPRFTLVFDFTSDGTSTINAMDVFHWGYGSQSLKIIERTVQSPKLIESLYTSNPVGRYLEGVPDLGFITVDPFDGVGGPGIQPLMTLTLLLERAWWVGTEWEDWPGVIWFKGHWGDTNFNEGDCVPIPIYLPEPASLLLVCGALSLPGHRRPLRRSGRQLLA